MKKYLIYFLVLLFASAICNLKAQTAAEYFKTLQQRVNTTGEAPSQTLYNLYVDNMNRFFSDNGWKDQVISMKSIRVIPPNGSSDWYYMLSIKTKNCSTLWYAMDYDRGMFMVESSSYPIEFKKYVSAEKQKIANAETEKNALESKAEEIFKFRINDIETFRRDSIIAIADQLTNSKIQEIKSRDTDIVLQIKPEELEKAVKNANANNYSNFWPSMLGSGEKYYIMALLEKEQDNAGISYLNYVKKNDIERLKKYVPEMEKVIETAFIEYVNMKKANYLQQANAFIRPHLLMLEEIFKGDNKLVQSKLENATEEQKIFYQKYLDLKNDKSYVDRFDELFPDSSTVDQDFENMKYYLRNYIYFRGNLLQ